MREYFIELSKYGITACMLIYTIGCFAAFSFGRETKRWVYVIQCVLLFLTQLMIFLNLFLVSGNSEYMVFYAFVQIFLLGLAVMVPLIYESAHKMLLNNICMLLGTGMGILSRLSVSKAVKQYIIALVSLLISLLIPYLLSRVRFLKKLTWAYCAAGLAALSLVLLLGEVTHGSRISFTLFENITFQPSEFVKILYVFFLAGAFRKKHSFGQVALTAALAGSHVIILVLSRDLGSALIFFVSYVFVVFAATGNYFYLAAGAVGGSGAAYAAYRLFAHVRQRVMVWREPWNYIDNQGWAITQSLFAMGSGSWFGMGLLKGNPKSIPYVELDFIFSAVCEELGIIFGLCLLLVTLSCFMNICKISLQVQDRFYRLIVFGIGIMYIFQIFLTVGGGMNLIPLTGVTLPFLSYGGSSCMTSMIMFFIIQGIYIRMKQEEKRHAGREKSGETVGTEQRHEGAVSTEQKRERAVGTEQRHERAVSTKQK